jgi:hypothetical protein
MRTLHVLNMSESIIFISTLLHGLFVLFTQTWGNAKPWDPSTIFSIRFTTTASPGNSGQIYIDYL